MVKWWFWAFPDDDPKKWSKSGQKMVPARPGPGRGSKKCQKYCQKIVFWWSRGPGPGWGRARGPGPGLQQIPAFSWLANKPLGRPWLAGRPHLLRPSKFIRLPPSTETKNAKLPKIVKNWFLHRPNQVVKKLSNGGFWPSQMMTPKSGEKVIKKLSKNGPSPARARPGVKKIQRARGPGPGAGPARARPGPPKHNFLTIFLVFF